MGFRFRKLIKILPGFWFNLSKSGISTSIGGKGLTVNLKDGKTRTTVGIPGTGISYRTTSTSNSDNSAPTRAGIPAWVWVLIVAVIVVLIVVVFNVK
jgi:Protein of unknown function (DUF4236)